ncbi:MAG: hypothetical protein ACXAC8_10160 [Candidatus Hodarchaeales archaeon]|jgi:hypothetical protein
MASLYTIFNIIHVVNAVLMAWPFYALVAVNQRVKLGPPLGDRVDTYMENIIKNRTIPCFVFQVTAMVTGLLLVLDLYNYDIVNSLGALMTNLFLGLKFSLLVLIATLLSYVHLNLQPRIDNLFAQIEGNSAPTELAKKIGVLRLQRKRMASVCLFVVLTEVILGVQTWLAFDLLFFGVLVLLVAAFTWRTYQSEIPYGWV